MATATVTTAPTEAEIRAAILAELAELPGDNEVDKLTDTVDRFSYAVDWHRDRDIATDELIEYSADIWTDLRPSQADRLAELVGTARQRAYERAHAVILEEFVSAALAFAAEYPDAPRATREAATA
jgi:hypothetical protein